MSTPIAQALTANGLLNRYLNSNQDKVAENPAAQINRMPSAENPAKSVGDVAYTPSASRMGAMFQAEQAFAYSESMNLQLTTREGDTVSVDFRQLYAQYQSYKAMQYAEQGGETPQGYAVYQSQEAMQMAAFEQRFAMSIEGDLNDNELGAIFDVFEQVDQIANQFYGGNLEQALQSAVEMKVDFGQLQNVSLNLTQSASLVSRQQQAGLAEYGANRGQAEEQSDMGAVEQLPEYYQKWQQALDALSQWFDDSQSIWDDLTGKVAAQRFPEQDSENGWLARVKAFHQQFAEFANPAVSAQTDVNPQAEEGLEPSKA
ncbi:hypothetical protein THMIRHAS_21410 [Thiosulfatimonas sediminis]|uniref:DUF5610 domain-containing protein n=1 Tax=Thiosulfatimonas sediminis TaxID=2675054 RepID=A0A6F8PXP9_9GAMM|nr:hypothetical protein [Thiosulfatimonas sediminis]BBP46768.1 hypothetical protein THMIRHAS_21410 [Thiosulfatimonas sediminis]